MCIFVCVCYICTHTYNTHTHTRTHIHVYTYVYSALDNNKLWHTHAVLNDVWTHVHRPHAYTHTQIIFSILLITCTHIYTNTQKHACKLCYKKSKFKLFRVSYVCMGTHCVCLLCGWLRWSICWNVDFSNVSLAVVGLRVWWLDFYSHS